MFTPNCFIVAFLLFVVGIVLGVLSISAYIYLFSASIGIAGLGFVVYIIQEWHSE